MWAAGVDLGTDRMFSEDNDTLEQFPSPPIILLNESLYSLTFLICNTGNRSSNLNQLNIKRDVCWRICHCVCG